MFSSRCTQSPLPPENSTSIRGPITVHFLRASKSKYSVQISTLILRLVYLTTEWTFDLTDPWTNQIQCIKKKFLKKKLKKFFKNSALPHQNKTKKNPNQTKKSPRFYFPWNLLLLHPPSCQPHHPSGRPSFKPGSLVSHTSLLPSLPYIP